MTRSWVAPVVFAIWCGGAAGCSGAGTARTPTNAGLDVDLLGSHAQGDRITTERVGETLFLDVHSASGIGRARIEPPAAGWPRRIVFRMYLVALEGFEVIGTGRFEAGRHEAAPAGQAIEVELPREVAGAGLPLTVAWVDRYR
jgi:hypothetical protein